MQHLKFTALNSSIPMNALLRHMVVCRVAKKPALHTMSIDRKKQKLIFTYIHNPLSNCLSQKCPPGMGVFIPNLKKIAPAISSSQNFILISLFFLHFAHFAKSAIKHKRLIQSD